LALYPPEVSSVYLPIFASIKNMSKFIFLLSFYVSLFSKYKKLKKSREKENLKARFFKN